MRCPDCHKTVESSIKICPYCGAAIPESEPEFKETVKLTDLKNRKYSTIGGV